MRALSACVQHESQCANLVEEVNDLESFHALIPAILRNATLPRGSFSASAFFVTLHNIVTGTIARGFFGWGRWRFYCMEDVLETLSQTLVPELAQRGWEWSELSKTLFHDLPGFGHHRLVHCKR